MNGTIGLRLRMVVAIGALAAVTIGLIGSVSLFVYVVLSVLGIEPPHLVAAVVTVALFGTVGLLEYHQATRIADRADAHAVDADAAPTPHRLATKVATQLGVPTPTIAVSDRDAPEALAVGFRPDSITLVLSLGTLRALSEEELEAVIAHELAHVANRDAMVMTAVSLPVVLTDGVRARFSDPEHPVLAFFVVPILLVSQVGWLVGRTITAILSRSREFAADRVAVEVTGSPAALASALSTLDREIAETPTRDLRAVSGISSLSILPLEPEELEKVMLGPGGDVEPSYWRVRTRLHRLERALFRTHPPTESRLEALAELQAARE